MVTTNLVHQFPAFLYSLFVHGPGLVMGVEMVMVWLEGILHHSDEPPSFLQVPCHVRARLGLARAADRRGRAGVRGTEPPPGVSWTGRL